MADSPPAGGEGRTMVRYAEFTDPWRAFDDFLRGQIEGGGMRDQRLANGVGTRCRC